MKNTIKKIIGRGPLKAYHSVRSEIVSRQFGRPAKQMQVIGITGTNGKTTTANLISSIFETAGYRVALLTTIQFRINGEEVVNGQKMTAPSPRILNQFLAKARDAGCNLFIVEATSHALDQHRFAGIKFDCGVLTNITHDHLDYHGTFDRYVAAKRQLFNDLRLSVVNLDDPNGAEFNDLPADLHIPYSRDVTKQHALALSEVTAQDGYSTLTFNLPNSNSQLQVNTRLVGQFNWQNIMAAVAVALGFGIPTHIIQNGIAKMTAVPGRMQKVECGQPFTVIIDYAHTPDALEKMYDALKPVQNDGAILSVLGACGERDVTKRPILGQIAGREAKYVVITNEDPYSEDPQSIIDSVASGIEKDNPRQSEGVTYWRTLDRRAAIRHAFSLAKPNDVVTITGKGAETAMAVKGEFVPWSDKEVVIEELVRAGYGNR
ncbi:MAG: UDP-N-acetylmuramoyl-L-alanyl-D-glutamate--2,6-diaminopimelate ligase [Patescibacteria group bacterium]|jgi:UDP-N-acetylmuramoyl-L-alanyl-D-glutamate--2,6-diaminopimelate ligase